MTYFIDLRQHARGGDVAQEASCWLNGYDPLPAADLAAELRGRDVLFATHGFNVDRHDGVNSLTEWETCLRAARDAAGNAAGGAAARPFVFVGVLWPGDSTFIPLIDYPLEGDEANQAGRLLAGFLQRNCGAAQSFSFASHSLGGRMVLETVQNLCKQPGPPVQHILLMAAAIQNSALSGEYAGATGAAANVHLITSTEDLVLRLAYPLGNFFGEIVMDTFPDLQSALGRSGPAGPLPDGKYCDTWKTPPDWDYGHLDYMPHEWITSRFGRVTPPPSSAPSPSSQATPTSQWKAAWSAAVAGTVLG